MTAIPLSKPTASPTGLVITAASTIGIETGDTYRIKIVEYEYTAGSPSVSTTGDGDTVVQRENNLLLYPRMTIRGYLLNAYDVNVHNIASSTNAYVTVDVYAGATRRFAGTFIVEWVQARYNKEAPFVPIAMVLQGHNTTQSNAVMEPGTES